MSSFIATDVAVARAIRDVESASTATLRKSAHLITILVDASEARSLSPMQDQDTLARAGRLVTDAIAFRAESLNIHRQMAEMGQQLGLPVVSVGDVCQEFATSGALKAA